MTSVDIQENPFKKDFPLLDAHPELAFLDSAATAQRPAVVLDAQRYFYETMNANPLRGLYKLSVDATEAIGKTREHIARFIGVDSPREIVFGRNTSEMLNLLAMSFAPTVLSQGDEVCITIMEHHSNLIPWQQVCRKTGAKLVYIFPDEEGRISEEEMRKKIGPKTKIVSAVHVSNVLGVENPVQLLTQVAHENGAYMIVDGAQSVPHAQVNVKGIGCDFFVFSAHKVFGPMGIGVLWGHADLLDAMPPFLTGGEMIDSVTQEDAVWASVPEKFEAGTQDAAGIYGLDAALSYVENIGMDTIIERESNLVQYCMARLSDLPYIEFVGPRDAAARHSVISFNVGDIHPHDVASILDMHNVAIRAGHHCAQPLLNWMGLRTCSRASLAFYNDKNDIDALIEAIESVWGMFHGE